MFPFCWSSILLRLDWAGVWYNSHRARLLKSGQSWPPLTEGVFDQKTSPGYRLSGHIWHRYSCSRCATLHAKLFFTSHRLQILAISITVKRTVNRLTMDLVCIYSFCGTAICDCWKVRDVNTYLSPTDIRDANWKSIQDFQKVVTKHKTWYSSHHRQAVRG